MKSCSAESSLIFHIELINSYFLKNFLWCIKVCLQDKGLIVLVISNNLM